MQGRAIVGVIALYALLLQAFLGAIAPVSAAPGFPGFVLCAQDASGTPTPDEPDCPTKACCIQAQTVTLEAPAETASASLALAWSDRLAPLWPLVEADGARAPPERSVDPRGPPTA